MHLPVPLRNKKVQKLPPDFRACQHSGSSIINDLTTEATEDHRDKPPKTTP
jgi:hypothetical protein